MAYWITKFDTYDISAVSPSHDVGMPPANAPSVQTPYGSVDALGSARAIAALPYRLTVRAEDFEESFAALKTSFYLTRSQYGKRAKLYRTPDGGTANSEWAWARMVSLRANRDGNTQLAVPYTIVFEVHSPIWYGTDATETSTLATTSTDVYLENAGNADVRDPIVTVSAAGSAITSIRLQANSETDLTWAGTLGSGNDLVIDCGAQTIQNNGADAYSGLTRNAGHTVAYWLRAATGTGTAGTCVAVTRSGGSSDSVIEIAFYDGWY